jgi:polysaccharide biosynthesis protein PslE
MPSPSGPVSNARVFVFSQGMNWPYFLIYISHSAYSSQSIKLTQAILSVQSNPTHISHINCPLGFSMISTTMPLLEMWRQFARHWRQSLGFLLASVLVALLTLWLLPRHYHSEGKLYVRAGRETSSLDATATIGRASLPSAMPARGESDLNSTTEILQSRALLERVVDVIGPQAIISGIDPVDASASQAPHEDGIEANRSTPTAGIALEWSPELGRREKAIAKLKKMVKVQATKRSDVVTISCDGGSPRLAQKVVASLIDFYLAEHLRLNRTPRAREFLERQTAEMRTKLAQTEDDLRKLKNQTGLTSPDTQRKLITNRAAHLEDDLIATAAEVASAEAEVRMLREKVETLPKTTVTARITGVINHGTQMLRHELYRVQMSEQDLASKNTEEHFTMQQAHERAAEAKKVFEAEEASHDQITTGRNRVLEQAEIALVTQEPLLTSLQARADTLRSQLAEVREQIKVFNADAVQFEQLARDLKRHVTNYDAYEQYLEQTRIDEALVVGRISSINLIQPATFEVEPVSPKPWMVVGLGLMVGLIGAAGLPLTIEFFDQQLANQQDMGQRLDVPVVTSSPGMRTEQQPVPSDGGDSGYPPAMPLARDLPPRQQGSE